MLNRSQWQQLMDNLDRIKSNVQENIEDGMMADKKFNGDFADHIVDYLRRLTRAMQTKNKASINRNNWEAIEL